MMQRQYKNKNYSFAIQQAGIRSRRPYSEWGSLWFQSALQYPVWVYCVRIPLVIISLFLYVSSGESQNFELSGRIKKTVFDPQDRVRFAEAAKFTFISTTNGWYFRIEDYSDSFRGKSKIYEYIDASCDNTNITTLAKIDEKQNSPPESLKNKKSLTAYANIQVHRGILPTLVKQSFINELWFGFGSRYVFNESKLNNFKPLWLQDDTLVTNDQCYCEINLKYLDSRFVSAADIWDPGIEFRRSGNQVHIQKRNQPFDKGYISLRYQVDGVTNVSGVNVPMGFILTRYTPKVGGVSTNDIKRSSECACTVEKIESFEGINPVGICVPSNTIAMVRDRRDEQLSKPMYYTTSSNIPSITSLRYKYVNRQYHNKNSEELLAQVKQGYFTYVIYALFAISLIPLTIAVIKHLRTTNNKQKT